MNQSTGTLTLWQVRAVCAQREPDWTSDHCHRCERGERDDKSGKRRETTKKRKRTTEERKEREENPPPPPPHLSPSLLPVCRLKCLRVYRQNARMCYHILAWCRYTRRRFDLHTETFLTYTRMGFPRATPHTTHRQHTHHAHHAHTHHTPHITTQHNTPQHQNTKRTSDTHTHTHTHTLSTYTTLTLNTHAQHTTRHVHIHVHTPPSHHTHHTHEPTLDKNL